MGITNNEFESVPIHEYSDNGSSVLSEDSNDKIASLPNEYVEIQMEQQNYHKDEYYRERSLSKAEQKIDDMEQEAELVSQILQRPRYTSVTSITNNKSKHDDIVISTISPNAFIETGLTLHRDMKPGSQRFRWNILFNILVWLIVPFPFWIPFVSNKVAYYMIPSIQGVFVFMWIIIAVFALKNALILYFNRQRDFTKEFDRTEMMRIRHIFLMSCYKEPIDLISQSIQSVADQTEVQQVTMVIAFEQRTPDKEEKCKFLEEKFGDCGFERIIFTIHPSGVSNEIPGKCSNSNYGIRMAVQQMAIEEKDADNVLVTTCDTDSKFHPQYVAALTYKYLKDGKPALTTLYQSPLIYNWKLDSLSVVTRVTGLLRSLLMLGALIPFNINTMSIYSYSLSLGKKGNYVHPAYQMEDIICLIRWMGITGQRLKISLVPVPVLSGPTSGETVETEVMEWARQARRWTIGAAEVFHYFIIKSRRIPAMAAGFWGVTFIIYYGILLCTGGLYGLTSMLSMLLIVKDVPVIIKYIMYGMLGIQMLTFLIAFIIDGFIAKLLNIQECIFIVRNFYHFLATPFVLLAYSFVELYALHEVLIFGKKVCKHGASAKVVL
ncbi:unnamed protein product [Adineta steineri]|uniref:Glycosyltransferase 2-like domain-containing protein n=1 Tax=Adineta steineri TaxID=433720 RepID=A0A819UVM0_9BILA|nr:unnamed protein product [Adineta steineri]CAF4087085.1 unnamed protein product [Adineta steineri]